MGTAILRRYVLIGAIGQGGVSTVYAAVDARRGPQARGEGAGPEPGGRPAGPLTDVRREALITDRLRHPSVPRVFEYGEAPLPDGTVVPYVVLELLAGVPLTERLARGRLEWPEAVRIAATAADVLAVAHRRGVVHRDLTARNIMVSPAGIKIIDFGLATAAAAQRRLRRAPDRGAAAGSRARPPSHPKTAFARPADDVYTLGRAALRDADRPVAVPAGDRGHDRGRRPGRRTWPRPRCWPSPGLPPPLRDLVRACMAKRPEDRPRSADVALALWQILDAKGLRLPAPSWN